MNSRQNAANVWTCWWLNTNTCYWFNHRHVQTSAANLRMPMIEPVAYFWTCRCLNVLMFEWMFHSNFGTFIYGHLSSNISGQYQWLMVTEVSLFKVAEVPTNWYDYTLPKIPNTKRRSRLCHGHPEPSLALLLMLLKAIVG